MGDLSRIKPFKDEYVTEKKDKIHAKLQKWFDILYQALSGAVTIATLNVTSFVLGGTTVHLSVSITPVATTSGTSVSLTTTIPSWVRRISIPLAGISTNGTSAVILQIGPAGGLATANYNGSVANFQNGAAIVAAVNTNGFRIGNNWGAAVTMDGIIDLMLEDEATNTWAMKYTGARRDTTANIWSASGTIALSGPLTQIALTTQGGADTFDGGSAGLTYYQS